MNETSYTNILVAPVVISMVLNLLFLCNIIRVVLLKMKAPAGPQGSSAPSRNILQAFRWVSSWVARAESAYSAAAVKDYEL